MKNLFFTTVYIMIIFIIISCKEKSKTTTDEKSKINCTEELSSDIPEYAKFGIKSGIIEMESTVMGMKQNLIMYFDDWGRKIRNEIHMSFLGQKTSMATIIKGGWVYQIDLINNQGTKFPFDTTTQVIDNIDYLRMDEDMMKRLNMVYLGEVELLGRKCKEYNIKPKELGQEVEAKIAVWKGISLRSVIKTMGVTSNITATNIIENADIPAEKFQIPDNIDFQIQQGPI